MFCCGYNQQIFTPIIIQKRKLSPYNKYKGNSLRDYLNKPDSKALKVDRSLMNNYMSPWVSYLLKNGIEQPLSFAEIFKKYKINRADIANLIKVVEKQLTLEEVITSNRQLSHTNSFEKNILFTYQAYHDPVKMLDILKDYIHTPGNLSNVENKDQLLSNLEIEINKLQPQINVSQNVNSKEDEVNLDMTASNDSSPFQILNDQLEVESENEIIVGCSLDAYNEDEFCESNFEDEFTFFSI